ncbi:MAG: FHA domain-containing protein [Gammaproteobacteria bacterium]|nr:FHA domain-containing protein [Gammaproteobacteria bacterium]
MPGKLELTFNSNKLDEFTLDREVLTIGRKEDNDICIDNLSVSGHHAKLLTIFDDSFLEDLESTNGTFVNGIAVQKYPLKNGDVISIRKHELRYINDSKTIADDEDKTVLIRPKQEVPSYPNTAQIETVEFHSTVPVFESAKLQILNGSGAGKELPLIKPSVKLGKSGSEVVQINKRPDGHFIVCLDQPLGGATPKVNGADIGARSVKLENHDIIEINRLKIEFFLAG